MFQSELNSEVIRNSSRDPGGRLIDLNVRLLRIVTAQEISHFRRFMGSQVMREFVSSKRIVRTKFLEDDEVRDLFENTRFRSSLDASRSDS
jgi:hypothetical protein